VAVEFLSLAHQDLQVRRDSPEAMVNPVERVSLVLTPRPRHRLPHNPKAARPARPLKTDHPDLQDHPDPLANPEAPASLEPARPRELLPLPQPALQSAHQSAMPQLPPPTPTDAAVSRRPPPDSRRQPWFADSNTRLDTEDRHRPLLSEVLRPALEEPAWDHQDPLAHPEPQETPEAPDSQDSLDPQARSPKDPHRSDHQAHPDPVDLQETTEPRASPAPMESPESRDPLETVARTALLATLELPAVLANQAPTEERVLATTARRRALPQDIENEKNQWFSRTQDYIVIKIKRRSGTGFPKLEGYHQCCILIFTFVLLLLPNFAIIQTAKDNVL